MLGFALLHSPFGLYEFVCMNVSYVDVNVWWTRVFSDLMYSVTLWTVNGECDEAIRIWIIKQIKHLAFCQTKQCRFSIVVLQNAMPTDDSMSTESILSWSNYNNFGIQISNSYLIHE